MKLSELHGRDDSTEIDDGHKEKHIPEETNQGKIETRHPSSEKQTNTHLHILIGNLIKHSKASISISPAVTTLYRHAGRVESLLTVRLHHTNENSFSVICFMIPNNSSTKRNNRPCLKFEVTALLMHPC